MNNSQIKKKILYSILAFPSRTIKLILLLFIAYTQPTISKPITILLDPAGDAQHIGRVIDDSFERGLTLQLAESIKKNIEKSDNNVRIILTRIPGETLEPLQNVSFANRLNADFYVNINLYQEKFGGQKIFIYYLQYNESDLWPRKLEIPSFCSFEDAHLLNIKNTIESANYFYKTIKDNYPNKFAYNKPLGIPIRPLVGIRIPAISLEISLNSKNDWSLLVEPLSYGLSKIIEKLKNDTNKEL